jgi:hypothetical protein
MKLELNNENGDFQARCGTIAICSRGCIGLITNDVPQEIVYSDGTKDMAWIGIHLTDKVGVIGAPWSSRMPKVIGYINGNNIILPVRY